MFNRKEHNTQLKKTSLTGGIKIALNIARICSNLGGFRNYHLTDFLEKKCLLLMSENETTVHLITFFNPLLILRSLHCAVSPYCLVLCDLSTEPFQHICVVRSNT